MLLGHKKTWSTDTAANTEEPCKHDTERQKPDTGHVLYHSFHMKCPEQANPQKRKHIRGTKAGAEDNREMESSDFKMVNCM